MHCSVSNSIAKVSSLEQGGKCLIKFTNHDQITDHDQIRQIQPKLSPRALKSVPLSSLITPPKFQLQGPPQAFSLPEDLGICFCLCRIHYVSPFKSQMSWTERSSLDSNVSNVPPIFLTCSVFHETCHKLVGFPT